MIKTRFTDLVGIDHPIVCGTMHLVTGPSMVAAMANAGALGILYTTGYLEPEELREDLRRVKALTDRPFGANINLFPTTKPVDLEGFIDILNAEEIRVIETSGRSPRDYVGRIKEGGAVFMHKVARVRDGISAVRLGADVVEIVGFESGGHPGEEDVGALVQTQALVRAIDLPIVAAGGYVDGRGLAAALALGAEAVCMGTRFMATRECPVHEDVKQWLLQAAPADTVIIERSLKNSMRVAKTGPALHVLEMEAQGAELASLLTAVDGTVSRDALLGGRLETAGVVCAGQAAGLVMDVPSIEELVDRTVREAEMAIARLKAALTDGG